MVLLGPLGFVDLSRGLSRGFSPSRDDSGDGTDVKLLLLGSDEVTREK